MILWAAAETQLKTRDISRKGTKHVLSPVEGAAKKLDFRTWRSWRLGASNSPFYALGPLENLCKPRKF